MISKRMGNTLAVRLNIGEEICEQLKAVCNEYNIKAGSVLGIGAVKGAVLGVYDIESRQYTENRFDSFMELCNLTGNVSEMNGDCYLHLHVTLADEKGNAFGGHLKSATIGATAEIFITVLDGEIGRKPDEETGINIFEW